MITLQKDETGYFNGDKVKLVGYEREDKLAIFEFTEGYRIGETIFQPLESVNVDSFKA